MIRCVCRVLGANSTRLSEDVWMRCGAVSLHHVVLLTVSNCDLRCRTYYVRIYSKLILFHLCVFVFAHTILSHLWNALGLRRKLYRSGREPHQQFSSHWEVVGRIRCTMRCWIILQSANSLITSLWRLSGSWYRQKVLVCVWCLCSFCLVCVMMFKWWMFGVVVESLYFLRFANPNCYLIALRVRVCRAGGWAWY